MKERRHPSSDTPPQHMKSLIEDLALQVPGWALILLSLPCFFLLDLLFLGWHRDVLSFLTKIVLFQTAWFWLMGYINRTNFRRHVSRRPQSSMAGARDFGPGLLRILYLSAINITCLIIGALCVGFGLGDVRLIAWIAATIISCAFAWLSLE